MYWIRPALWGSPELFPFVVKKWIFKHICDTIVCIYCSLLQIEINVNLFIVKSFMFFFFSFNHSKIWLSLQHSPLLMRLHGWGHKIFYIQSTESFKYEIIQDASNFNKTKITRCQLILFRYIYPVVVSLRWLQWSTCQPPATSWCSKLECLTTNPFYRYFERL